MDYRLLGRSGLKVSSLAIGTATFGGDGLCQHDVESHLAASVDLFLRGYGLHASGARRGR